MALRKVWIGSEGPFVFDDEGVYEDNPDLNYAGIRADTVIRVNNIVTDNLSDKVRMAYSDSNKELQEVDDLTDFIKAGDGISIADNGDGTITIEAISTIIESHEEEFSFEDSYTDEVRNAESVIENYDESITFSDSQSESDSMPDNITESVSDNISFNEDSGEDTAAPISESHDEVLSTAENMSETIGDPPSSIDHEWDSQGIVLGSGTEINEWSNNEGSINFAPEDDPLHWNSTEEYAIAENNDEGLLATGLGIDLNNCMILMVVDFSLYPDWAWAIQGGTSDGEAGNVGGLEIVNNGSGGCYCNVEGSTVGGSHIDHNNDFCLIAVSANGGDITFSTHDNTGEIENTTGNGMNAGAITSRLVLGKSLNADGGTNRFSGNQDVNVRAIRVWDNNDEESSRISDMINDYL